MSASNVVPIRRVDHLTDPAGRHLCDLSGVALTGDDLDAFSASCTIVSLCRECMRAADHRRAARGPEVATDADLLAARERGCADLGMTWTEVEACVRDCGCCVTAPPGVSDERVRRLWRAFGPVVS